MARYREKFTFTTSSDLCPFWNSFDTQKCDPNQKGPQTAITLKQHYSELQYQPVRSHANPNVNGTEISPPHQNVNVTRLFLICFVGVKRECGFGINVRICGSFV
jgi:hypothetical protein